MYSLETVGLTEKVAVMYSLETVGLTGWVTVMYSLETMGLTGKQQYDFGEKFNAKCYYQIFYSSSICL